jgi:adenine-specific DNA-methyltransferase
LKVKDRQSAKEVAESGQTTDHAQDVPVKTRSLTTPEWAECLFEFDEPSLVDPREKPDVPGIVALAVALGAQQVPGWSPEEQLLTDGVPEVSPSVITEVRSAILAGGDPLGDLFCRLRPAEERRKHGATYTPQPIVDVMVEWAAQHATPNRVVDPGLGSGRYTFEHAQLIGIEVDPLPAIIARASLATLGMEKRARVIVGDYRSALLPPTDGRTLFIGNPPYIRHHLLEPKWKQWLSDEARKCGFQASQLAGLHVHFFLATLLKASRQDFGAFITAAEWLDVNYGSLVRELFLGPLGGGRIVVVEPDAMPFPDAATTAAITYFEVGSKPETVKLKRVAKIVDITHPDGDHIIRRERLITESRWSHLTRPTLDIPEGFIELGELCQVHRGQVTGANRVWIAGPHSDGLPSSVLFPTITRAKELFRAGAVLKDSSTLRRVIDIPIDLDELERDERSIIDSFLEKAKSMGAHVGYVATNRRAWWSVRLREPAPILATYMARRPPAFVENKARARHINIAHGLYPREPLGEPVIKALVNYLSRWTNCSQGRTYAGGLTKFEPREMERLPIPAPENLTRYCL